MAWNEPGQGQSGQNNQNPWGQRGNRTPGPPDLEQLFRKWFDKLKKLSTPENRSTLGGGGGNGFGNIKTSSSWGAAIIGVLMGLYLVSGVYIVDPPERAVVTRFGKYVRTVGPGPHWLPPLIESKEIVNVDQVATSDHSGLILTRDRNIASVGVAVQYRVGDGEDDVRAYLFNVASPVHSLKMSTESALRQVVGQSTMDDVLTLRRAEIANAIKEQLVETLEGYHTGLMVIDIAMQFAKAPDEVRAAFDDVIKAAADEERLVNQARAYENEVIPRARGTVERLKNEALGYKQETILISEGNVQRFNLILPHYQKAPKVTQVRLYLEAIERILSQTTKIMVDAGLGNNILYLPLDKMMPAFNGAVGGGNALLSAENLGHLSSLSPSIPAFHADQKEKN